MNRLYDKIDGIVKQAHGAFANFLVMNYDTVIMPEFMTAGMVKKRRKKLKLPPIRDIADTNTPRQGGYTLHKTTRKAASSIAHYQFRQRLFAKAKGDPSGKKDVVLNTEEYTTKQCPFCPFVHHKIGGNKVFQCQNEDCLFRGPRDCVGAFNGTLRAVVKKEVTLRE